MHKENLRKSILGISLVLVPVVLFIPLRSISQRNEQRRKNNAMLFALQQGNFKAVQELIAQGANPNAWVAYDQTTPLQSIANSCSASDSVETARVLLRHGAKINHRNEHGYTALMFAANSGCVDLVALLLSNGANVANKDIHGDTALSLARTTSDYYELKITKMLKQAGAKQ
jgi:ankyrin repeat protein